MIQKGIEVTFKQNSQEWLDWRGIGGSDAAALYMGDRHPFESVITVWKEKTGRIEKEFTEEQRKRMDRGHTFEPIALEIFTRRTGIVTEKVSMRHSLFEWATASLDGMTEDRSTIVEVKAPVTDYGLKLHKSAIETGEPPEMYYIQMQHQFWITGAVIGFYVSYDPEHFKDDDPHQFVCLPVYPNYGFIEGLILKEQAFQWYIDNDVPPTEDLNILRIANQIGLNGLVQFTGYAQAGKDTFGNIYADLFESSNFRYANPLKEAAIKIELVDERIFTDLAYKKKMRAKLVALGAGMRAVEPDVWIKGVFNMRSGLFEAMQTEGAHITDCRYLNEYSYGVRYAHQFKVPHKLIWIERPGIVPANEEESLTTSLLKPIADIIIHNNHKFSQINAVDIKNHVFRAAILAAIGSGKKEVKVSDYV